MDRSIMVTKVAMIVMNAAIRILSGIILRIAEITILEQMRTTVAAAAPMPIAFCREVVVASVGQKTDRLHENRVIEDNARFQLFRKFHLAFLLNPE